MIYTAKLKTRKQMERDIPRSELGWWHDVCAGQTLELREATAEDLARCSLREGTSRDPADYLCENFERGSLVSRKAVAVLTPWEEARLEQAVRDAIHRFGAERFARALAEPSARGALASEAPTVNARRARSTEARPDQQSECTEPSRISGGENASGAGGSADPIRELLMQHATLIEEGNNYAYFELAYTRQTGWMAWLTDRPAKGEPGTAAYAASRKVIARGQGDSPDEACADALAAMAGGTNE